MNKFDIQLIQDTGGKLLLYDDTQRAFYPTDVIDYNGTTSMVGTGSLYDPYIYMQVVLPNDTTTYDIVITDDGGGSAGLVDVAGTSMTITHTFDFTLNQEDFLIDISDVVGTEVNNGFVTYSYVVGYKKNNAILQWSQNATMEELAYKDIEIYRAQMFEKIARNHNLYDTFQQKVLTEDEIFMQGARVFDTYFKSMRAALELGDRTSTLNILAWLENYKALNPIE